MDAEAHYKQLVHSLAYMLRYARGATLTELLSLDTLFFRDLFENIVEIVEEENRAGGND